MRQTLGGDIAGWQIGKLAKAAVAKAKRFQP